MRRALICGILAVAGLAIGSAGAQAGAFVNTVTFTDPDGSSSRTHEVITPGGNFSFSMQEKVVLGPGEQLRRVGAANFNANRDSGTLTQTEHFTGADVGTPASDVMHDNFGPNGLTSFCHSNDNLCP
jgi:hypothetical protein